MEQYAGRLHRDYEGKAETVIYDYVDVHVAVLEKMYHKRLRAYKKIGYEIGSLHGGAQITTDMIFGSENYLSALTADLENAREEIIISSPGVGKRGTKWFLDTVYGAQMSGVKLTLRTLSSESYPEEARKQNQGYQEMLMENGIHITAYPMLYPHFVVIDRKQVWYGDMNVLSTPKTEDTMIRLENRELAEELLQLSVNKL